ncbi:MAG TPA: hypothetical protein VJ986_12040 [Gaiellaceae bacterium]|nr:hypothetical protein [Gaiellaceae bacterium]
MMGAIIPIETALPHGIVDADADATVPGRAKAAVAIASATSAAADAISPTLLRFDTSPPSRGIHPA